MTAAVRALIDDGFQHLELNRIQARVATANYPSQAVCDRLGLKKEGVLRQAEWLYDHYVDLTMNSVLRSEWNQKVWQLNRLSTAALINLLRHELWTESCAAPGFE
jgi:ribosomal-protein-serine acetyltransferase